MGHPPEEWMKAKLGTLMHGGKPIKAPWSLYLVRLY